MEFMSIETITRCKATKAVENFMLRVAFDTEAILVLTIKAD